MTYEEIEELAGHRQVSAWVIKLVNDAIAIEREACARTSEDVVPRHTECGNKIAAAIRVRGQV
jgi:hypothetical protein